MPRVKPRSATPKETVHESKCADSIAFSLPAVLKTPGWVSASEDLFKEPMRTPSPFKGRMMTRRTSMYVRANVGKAKSPIIKAFQKGNAQVMTSSKTVKVKSTFSPVVTRARRGPVYIRNQTAVREVGSVISVSSDESTKFKRGTMRRGTNRQRTASSPSKPVAAMKAGDIKKERVIATVLKESKSTESVSPKKSKATKIISPKNAKSIKTPSPKKALSKCLSPNSSARAISARVVVVKTPFKSVKVSAPESVTKVNRKGTKPRSRKSRSPANKDLSVDETLYVTIRTPPKSVKISAPEGPVESMLTEAQRSVKKVSGTRSSSRRIAISKITTNESVDGRGDLSQSKSPKSRKKSGKGTRNIQEDITPLTSPKLSASDMKRVLDTSFRNKDSKSQKMTSEESLMSGGHGDSLVAAIEQVSQKQTVKRARATPLRKAVVTSSAANVAVSNTSITAVKSKSAIELHSGSMTNAAENMSVSESTRSSSMTSLDHTAGHKSVRIIAASPQTPKTPIQRPPTPGRGHELKRSASNTSAPTPEKAARILGKIRSKKNMENASPPRTSTPRKSAKKRDADLAPPVSEIRHGKKLRSTVIIEDSMMPTVEESGNEITTFNSAEQSLAVTSSKRHKRDKLAIVSRENDHGWWWCTIM